MGEKKGYRDCEHMAKRIFATAQNGIPVLPNAPSTKISVTEPIRVLHNAEASREAILAQMRSLTKTLPEYSMVRKMPCIGDTLAPRLIAEIGGIRRFHSKRVLIAYAGIDAPPYQSGRFYANNRHISKRGNRYLRKTGYEVMHKPAGNPVFAFIEKKHSPKYGLFAVPLHQPSSQRKNFFRNRNAAPNLHGRKVPVACQLISNPSREV